MNFGEKLSLLRKQHGMTQLELAEKLNLSRQAVSRWERGTAEPSTENLVRIAALFGVPVDALVNDGAPLQTEPAAQAAPTEEKSAAPGQGRPAMMKMVAIMVLVIAVALAFLIGMMAGRREALPEENPIDMEDIERETPDPDDLDVDGFLIMEPLD